MLYNSLFGNPYVIDESMYAFLSVFDSPSSITPFLQTDNSAMTLLVSQLLLDHFLVIPGSDEREVLEQEKAAYLKNIQISQAISHITLLVSEVCNFKCLYCYQRNLRSLSLDQESKQQIMSFDTAKRALEVLTANALRRNIHTLDIGFNGGEALTNWNLIHKLLYYVHDTFGDKFTVNWGLNTNASLITPQIAKVLKKFDVHVITSLDGDRTANDRIRITSLGKGTYDLIHRGIQILYENDVKMDGIYVTLTLENIYAVNEGFLDMVADMHISVVSLEPDFTRPYPIDSNQIVEMILLLRSQGLHRGIRITGSWERPFQGLMSSRNFVRCNFFCSAVAGTGVTITPLGNLIPCTGIPTICGSIWEPKLLLHSEKNLHTLIDSRHIGSISGCIGCEIEGLCSGGCYLVNISAEYNHNMDLWHQRCRMLKMMTRRLLNDWLKSYNFPSGKQIMSANDSTRNEIKEAYHG